MMALARESKDGTPIRLGLVAERAAISHRYLEQLAIPLKNAGLLRAVLGKKGGHALAKPPRDITVREIIEAAIGTINIVECVGDPEDCMMAEDCSCRCLYALINHKIRETLSAFTLADLVEHRIEKIAASELTSTSCQLVQERSTGGKP